MAARVLARPQPSTLAQQALACTLFAALMGVSARIAFPVPGTPVPFSLQPLALMLTGMFLGSKLGFLALAEYVAAGALGAPVFANGGGGPAYLAAVSSAGYLYSYPVAAYLIGLVSERGRSSFGRLLVAGLVGLVVIYFGGSLYLWFWYGWSGKSASLVQAFTAGTMPFILFDIIKADVAAAVALSAAGTAFMWRTR